MTASSSRNALRLLALACGVAGVAAIVFGGRALRSWSPLWGLFATLWLVLPALTWLTLAATARGAHERAVERLQLRSPRATDALAAPLFAPALVLLAAHASAWERAIGATDFVAASPVPLREMDMAARILVLVVSPAIVEELYFRGALLAALRRGFSDASSVAIGAALFGAAHLATGSFLPAALLGAALTFLTLRTRSLVPSIVLHGAYNGLLVLGAGVERPLAFDLACAAAGCVLLAMRQT
ncbi:MAG: lysostaphin resistance A-like protein [Planctomycetota bacterium]